MPGWNPYANILDSGGSTKIPHREQWWPGGSLGIPKREQPGPGDPKGFLKEDNRGPRDPEGFKKENSKEPRDSKKGYNLQPAGFQVVNNGATRLQRGNRIGIP